MQENIESIKLALKKVIKGDVFSDVIHRAAYSSDASVYRITPDIIVVARDTDDIIAVVKYAAENNIPIAPRGAGSGVGGESLCSGIVIDIRQYMRRIISVTEGGKYVTVEPGVVLSELNDYLADYNTKIGPDPSTANRACIGGCLANNATGAHSLRYGYMADHVESIEIILDDASVVEFTNNMFVQDLHGRASDIAYKCFELLSSNEKLINSSLPATDRNRSGYNIAGVCHDGRIDMATLLAGSEGTLGIFTKIKLKTVPVEPEKALVQFEFKSFADVAKAVPLIVQSGADACELMDDSLIKMAIEAFPKYSDILPADAKAILLVEHTGDSLDKVKEKIANTADAVGKLAYKSRTVFDADDQKRIWKSRKDAVPLLGRDRGTKVPVPFIEDVSVDSKLLGEYIAGMEKVAKRYNIEMSYYGHAGDGELHIRPYLDLGDKADVKKMVDIANDVFTLAWSMGGSISGEHADGLVRAAYIRGQYGDDYYDILCKLKNIFDPAEILNPGKIINSDPDIMIKNLKVASKIEHARLKSSLAFGDNELERQLSVCSGCGLCLSRESDFRMCPVFRATNDELGSSRAKVNVLNAWVRGLIDDKQVESPEFRSLLDMCVNCKLCSKDCPSGVDVSTLMVMARTEYAKRKGLSKQQIVLSRNRYLGIMNTKFGNLANWFLKIGLFKKIIELFTGIDSRRAMPRYEFGTFLRKANKYLKKKGPIEDPIDKVAFFTDTFVNYNDHKLGFAVLDILRHNKVEVIIPQQRPVPLPAIVYGDFKTAKKDLVYSVKYLADAVRAGYRIICSEPSAALCLKSELRHFVDTEDAQLVSANTFEFINYLKTLSDKGQLKQGDKTITSKYTYHTPCHLFAAGGSATIELLNQISGIKVDDIKGGCCGLAGTFGMQKAKYDLSLKISENLKKKLHDSDCSEVLTECAACGMQIEHISGKKAIHPAKILAKLYGL